MLVLVKQTADSVVWVHLVQLCVLMLVLEDVRHVSILVVGNVELVHQNVQPHVVLNAISHVLLTVLTLVMKTVFTVARKYVEDVPISVILV